MQQKQIQQTQQKKKSDLTSLKSEIGKLDIGKLETTPVDLGKLNDAVKNEVVKKTKDDELVKEKLMLLILLILRNQLKKLTITEHMLKLSRKYLIKIIIISISPLQNLIS